MKRSSSCIGLTLASSLQRRWKTYHRSLLPVAAHMLHVLASLATSLIPDRHDSNSRRVTREHSTCLAVRSKDASFRVASKHRHSHFHRLRRQLRTMTDYPHRDTNLIELLRLLRITGECAHDGRINRETIQRCLALVPTP